jgi:hypothetical protein
MEPSKEDIMIFDPTTGINYTAEQWRTKVAMERLIESGKMFQGAAPEGNLPQGWNDHDYIEQELTEETFGGIPTQGENPKEAMGALKAPMNACPNTALIELYAVMGGGAHKYGLFNFRDTKISAMTYIGAIRRHFMLWEDGQNTDDESGRSHLAHIMACCALALDAQHTNKLVDDRSKTGLVPLLLKSCADSHNRFAKENLSAAERAEGIRNEPK